MEMLASIHSEVSCETLIAIILYHNYFKTYIYHVGTYMYFHNTKSGSQSNVLSVLGSFAPLYV